MPTQLRNSDMVDLLMPDFVGRAEPNYAWRAACSQFLALPGLRGFWPMSAFGATGQAFDQSENVRTLTYNGNPTYNQSNLIHYIEFDGTGDFLSRLDEAGLDIIGTETYVSSGAQGLTMGGWFWFDALDASLEHVIGKVRSGVAGTYHIWRPGVATISFVINALPGTTIVSSNSAVALTWQFIVVRFVPSTTLDIWLQNIKTSLITAIAAINNDPTGFAIGADDIGTAATFFDGRASMCFLCAQALSDSIINALFHNTRAMFNV